MGDSSIVLPAGRHAALLLHGIASLPLELRFMGKLLQRSGFSVSIPVLPGYSYGSPCSTWKDWLQAAQSEYDALASRYQSVSVAGLSAGATLAVALAQTRPGIRALGLWAVVLHYDGWAVPWYWSVLEPLYLLGLAGGYSYQEREPFGLKNERWRARVAATLRSGAVSAVGPSRISARYLVEATRLGRFVERRLPRVTVDTLVVHAADDDMASPANAQAVHAGISSLHKRKILLGDSYHIITLDNERDLVARETIRFFQESVAHTFPEQSMKLVSSARAVMRLQRRRATAK